MTDDIHRLRKAFLEEDGGAWIAGEDLAKEAAMVNVEVAGKSPSSMELMLIKDPAERERYRADMAARNESRAMKRPLSPKETVTRQAKTASVRDFFSLLVKNPHKRELDMAIQDASRKTGRKPEELKLKDILKSYNQLYPKR
jgi:hypothetical protein